MEDDSINHEQRQLQTRPGVGGTGNGLADGRARKGEAGHSLQQEVIREGMAADQKQFLPDVERLERSEGRTATSGLTSASKMPSMARTAVSAVSLGARIESTAAATMPPVPIITPMM